MAIDDEEAYPATPDDGGPKTPVLNALIDVMVFSPSQEFDGKFP